MRKKIPNFTFEKFAFFLFLFALVLISAKSAAAQTIMSNSSNILEIKASSTLTNSVLKFVPSTSANSFSLQGIAPGATTVSIFDYQASTSTFKMLNGTLNYNPSNNYIGIGLTNPTQALHIASNIRVNGDIINDGNYGTGLVGLYSATRYQNVFAMGAAYRLAANGTAPGNMYGIAWTHSNIGGQSKAGLAHQALFMTNGVTQTAIGTGIWTLGGYTQTGTAVNTFSGNIGINTTVPQATLDVDGLIKMRSSNITTTSDVINKGYLDSALGGVFSSIDLAQYWKLSGSNLYPSSTAWNVGIGVVAPAEKLDVYGNIRMSNSGANQLQFTNANVKIYRNGNSMRIDSYDGWKFYDMQGSAERMRLTNLGNLGIGTTTPSEKLSVIGNIIIPNNYSVLSRNVGNNVSVPLFKFNTSDALEIGNWEGAYVSNTFIKGGNGSVYVDFSDGNNANFIVRKVSGVTPTELMRVVDSGNVGINTTAPTHKLHVAGDASFFNGTSPSVIHGVASPVTTTDAVNRGYVDSNFAPIGGSASLWATSSAGTYNVPLTNKIGIGTTNPLFNLEVMGATGNPGILAIAAPINDSRVVGAETASLQFKGPYGSGYNPNYITAKISSVVDGPLPATGRDVLTFSLYNPGGSIENPPVPSPYLQERMRITSYGNVGIGTTNPAAKLDVYGGVIRSTTNTGDSWNFNFLAQNNGEGGAIIGLASGATSKQFNVEVGGTSNTHVGSGNFGIYDDSNNAARFVINQAGNVGIGTTTPIVPLVVNGLIKMENAIIGTTSDVINKGYLDSALNGVASKWAANGSNIYRNTGNVGIGTTIPVTKLNVESASSDVSNSAGVLKLSTPSTHANGLNMGVYDGNYTWIQSYGSIPLMINALGNNTVLNRDSGNVGVGIAPTQKLHVGGNILATGNIYPNNQTVYGFKGNDVYTDTLNSGGSGDTLEVNYRTAGPVKICSTANCATYSAFFATNGNVGVGTTVPAYKLDVAGGANFNSNQVHGVSAPTAGTDAVNKNYVDTNFAPISVTNYWNANGSHIYNNNAGNVGVGNSAPAQKFSVGSAASDYIQSYGGFIGNPTANIGGTGDAAYFPEGIYSAKQNWFYGGIQMNNGTLANVGSANFSGNVGIGTSAPATKLEVTGGPLRLTGTYLDINRSGSAASGISWYSNSYNAWSSFMSPTGSGMGPKGNLTIPSGSLVTSWALRSFIENSGGYGWTFESGASTATTTAIKFEIRSSDGSFKSYGNGTVSGNLGVGMAPSYKLDVAGGANFNGNQIHGVSAPATGTDAANRNYVDSLVSSVANYWTANGTNIYNNNVGNVGIGVNTPLAKLQINNEATFNTLIPGPAAYYGLHFGGQTTADYATGITWNGGTSGTQAGLYVQGSGSYGTKMYFATTNSYATGAQTRMIIDQSGNVGIGTTAPGAYKLYVNGAVYANANLTTGGDVYVAGGDIYDANGDLHVLGEDNLYLKMDYNNDDADIRNIIFAKNTGLATAPTVANELMRITEAGNVGIGISNPSYLLHVKGEASFGNSVVHEVSAPVTSTDAVNRYYVDTNFAPLSSSFWTPNPNNPNHIYNTNSGYVGIGVSAPAQKLDVAGTINASSGFKVNNTATSGYYLRGNGSNFVASTIQAGDVPTLNQNTSGYAGYLISEDNRSISPSELARNMMKFGFTSYKNDNSYPYADFLHFNSYADSSGGNDNLLVFNKRALGMRLYQEVFGSASPYTKYKDVVLAENTPAANYLTKYSTVGDEVTVAASSIYDNGTYVGIGTATPTSKLHVVGSSYLNGTIKTNLTGTGSRCLHVDASGVIGTMAGDCGTSTGGDNLGNGIASSNIALGNYWLSGDGGNEGVFVKADGKVGIGDSAPGNKLTISGDVGINGSSNSILFNLHTISASGRSYLNFQSDEAYGAHTYSIDSLYAVTSNPTLSGAILSLNPSGGGVSFGGSIVVPNAVYNADSSRWLSFGPSGDSLKVAGNLNTTAGTLKVSGTGNSWIMGKLGIGTTNPNSTAGMTIDTAATAPSILFRNAGSDKALISFRNGINFTMNSSIGAPVVPGNTGSYNIGIGSYTFYTGTGSSNIGIGVGAARSSSGNGNIAIGISAMDSTGAGSSNIAIGNSALYQGTSGAYNIAIGVNALNGSGIGDGNIAIGNRGQWTNSSNKLYIGDLNPGLTDLPLIYGDMTSTTTGAVGIKTTNLQSGMAMTVAGKVYADDFIYSSSDARLKHDIKNLSEIDYQKILKLRPVSFTYNKNNSKGFGFIAQELEKLYPEMVETNESDGMKSVTYDNLISPTIMAIQEQQKKIEEQETLIQILLDRVNKLENSTK